jgi:hypothetical protein
MGCPRLARLRRPVMSAHRSQSGGKQTSPEHAKIDANDPEETHTGDDQLGKALNSLRCCAIWLSPSLCVVNAPGRTRSAGRVRLIIFGPAWWAPNGFAAIPTTALDPPHRAASPAVPALIGSGSPSPAMSMRLLFRRHGHAATVSISASFWNSVRMSR